MKAKEKYLQQIRDAVNFSSDNAKVYYDMLPNLNEDLELVLDEIKERAVKKALESCPKAFNYLSKTMSENDIIGEVLSEMENPNLYIRLEISTS